MSVSSPRNAELLRRLAAFVAVGFLFDVSGAIGAETSPDTATRFVEQLRAEGHGDLVLDYLERAQNDPLVSDAFKRRIPYQRLASRVEQAESLDAAARAEALAALEPELRQLAAQDADAKGLLTDVADLLAVAAADQARRDALEAERHPVPSQRADLKKAARSAIDDARSKLSAAESLTVAERADLKGVQPASPEGRRRADLGVRLALVRLLNARLIHEKAQTFPAGSAENKQLNQQAAKELGALYEKYSKLGAGLYAHLYEGRCYRLLGEKQLAIAALEDLTAQPASTPELRRVVTLAYAELAALALDNGDADKALGKPADWLSDLSADEKNGPEGAALRYRLGLAAMQKAESAQGAAAKKLRREARDWLGDASRVPSEVQADAREQWAAVSAELGVELETPETFDEAVAAGAEAIQSMLAFDASLKEVQGEAAATLTEQRRAAYDAAYAALTAAVRLAGDKADPEDAARARYQLAWLDWDGGDAAKAASRAELIARHDAETESGEQAAKLGLAALERLQQEGVADAGERLQKLAQFILQKWPSSDVSEAASAVLVANALRSGDLQAAERVLATVPEEQRPELALRLAVARWEASKKDEAKASAALASMTQAFDTAVAKGDPSPLAVTAALYLAGAALDEGDAQRAGELLQNDRYGPLTRLDAGKAPADSVAFALATLKASIRTGALSGGDVAQRIDQFQKRLAEGAEAQTGGDRAWLGLAVELFSDVDRADTDSAKAAIATALVAVLDQLGAVEAAGDWNTRLWIAQARLRAGELLPDSAAAEACVAAGRDAFAGLIEQAQKRPTFAPSPTAVLAARLKLAECQRALGEYAEAVDTLAAMLDGGPVLLDVQRVAAETLQAWGQAAEDVERLEESIAGARPGADGKNLIWGWSKLAAVAGRYVASDPSRRQVYFEAWRRVAEARFQSAMLSSGADRAEQLRKAAGTILAVQRKNPDLGGPESKQAYDALLRKIQQAAGLPVEGLSKAGG